MTIPSAATTRVVKVGGSLLSRPELGQRLNHFLENSPVDRNVIVVGGGSLVDTVRKWHETYPVTEDWCHRTSLRLMTETARLLSEICQQLTIVCEIASVPKQGNVILDCQRDMLTWESLEASWRVTSDSIAAEIANRLSATELWLLKSGSPESKFIREWASEGWVDECFTQIHDHRRPLYLLNMAVGDSLPLRGD